MKIEKKYHFYAAHRNPQGGQKCGRIHGHTYDVVITLELGVQDSMTGVTMLFSDIDEKLEPLFKSYCHWFLVYEYDPIIPFLNKAGEPFKMLPFITSAENLAQHFYECIEKKGLPIERIELKETKSSGVIYEG